MEWPETESGSLSDPEIIKSLGPDHRVPGPNFVLRDPLADKRILVANAIECGPEISIGNPQQQRSTNTRFEGAGGQQPTVVVQALQICPMGVHMRQDFLEWTTITNQCERVHRVSVG